MRSLPRPALFACLFLVPAALAAELVLAPPFRDGAVLQREMPLPVWGKADAGASVTVTFGEASATAVADELGSWKAVLPALSASSEARELVAASGEERLVVGDVLVGEVWIASGQSNMEWVIRNTLPEEQRRAAEPTPLVREFKVERTVSQVPADTVAGSWRPALPEHTPEFGAVSYHFARRLHEELGVPVGIVKTTWGGTPIEAWMSQESLAENPAFHVVFARWHRDLAAFPLRDARHRLAQAAWERRRDEARAAGQPFPERAPTPPAGPGHRNSVSGLYNAMVAPLVPFAVRGFLWYQGESNVSRHGEYGALFKAMITDWRKRFGGGEAMPFLYVQIAPFAGNGPNANPDARPQAYLREAQAAALALPGVGEATTLDVGTIDDIHPRAKLPVGERLAHHALATSYGRTGQPVAPRIASANREGTTWVLEVAEARALVAADPADVKGFEVAGPDRVFQPARARIDGTRVIVEAPASVADPVAVRHAFKAWVTGDLKDDEGLPVNLFRSDDWPAQ